jgi:hypothetical protein
MTDAAFCSLEPHFYGVPAGFRGDAGPFEKELGAFERGAQAIFAASIFRFKGMWRVFEGWECRFLMTEWHLTRTLPAIGAVVRGRGLL